MLQQCICCESNTAGDWMCRPIPGPAWRHSFVAKFGQQGQDKPHPSIIRKTMHDKTHTCKVWMEAAVENDHGEVKSILKGG